MIVGLGIDVVRIARVWAVLERKGARARSRLFTAAEAERCAASKHPPESFAARFAAKEALFKALGTGWGIGGAWTEVEVVSAATGAPSLRLSGRAAALAEARGAARIHLSMTHDHDTAAAVVILEAEPPRSPQ
ncbi:holo-ACP synthase [Longimicrobium sp.]|uniref:holo-ACP synthase n=1 Tax=Longimicrobium sp. TaxID=2029185 RepID=UPI002CC3A632|nr:holo-ACP synthase [Longimicrobium sp.]HSU16212.1 holo-ACP synthase [Longimicrobium sp.]